MKTHNFLKDLELKGTTGEELIEKIYHKIYSRLLLDSRINFFFQGKDVDKIESMHRLLMASILNPDIQYDGPTLRKAHENLALNDSHFDIVAEHLLTVLGEFSVPDYIIEIIKVKVLPTRNDVLNR